MMRARALAAFTAHVDEGNAFDLEHACYCLAALNGTPYSRFVLRALYALEQKSTLAALVSERGAMYALALPDQDIFDSCAPREQVARTKQKRAECARVLSDLLAEGVGSDLPEKGVRCARCHSTDISFEFSQTRSADEGTTVFCYCTKCSKRWKM